MRRSSNTLHFVRRKQRLWWVSYKMRWFLIRLVKILSCFHLPRKTGKAMILKSLYAGWLSLYFHVNFFFLNPPIREITSASRKRLAQAVLYFWKFIKPDLVLGSSSVKRKTKAADVGFAKRGRSLSWQRGNHLKLQKVRKTTGTIVLVFWRMIWLANYTSVCD